MASCCRTQRGIHVDHGEFGTGQRIIAMPRKREQRDARRLSQGEKRMRPHRSRPQSPSPVTTMAGYSANQSPRPGKIVTEHSVTSTSMAEKFCGPKRR
jgi:hypothetical protein